MSTGAERKAAKWYAKKENARATFGNQIDVLMHWYGATKLPGNGDHVVGFGDSRRCGIGDFVVAITETCDRLESAE